MTAIGILGMKATVILVAVCYGIFDYGEYNKTKALALGFTLYLIVYAIVRSVFKFDAEISYKRCMSLLSSTIISSLAGYAIYFDESNKNLSLLDGYQSFWSNLAINCEIGLYIADVLTITKDQYAILPLVIHHMLGILFFSYASLHEFGVLMINYGLIQEACNPFWYAHQLLYQFRSYRKPHLKAIFYINALTTVAVYIAIRFVIVMPNAVLSTFQTIFRCPTCLAFDGLYSLICSTSLIAINSFNVIKLCKSILKAYTEKDGETSPPTSPEHKKPFRPAKSVKTH